MDAVTQLAMMVAEDLYAAGRTAEEIISELSKQVGAPLPAACADAIRSLSTKTRGECCTGEACN